MRVGATDDRAASPVVREFMRTVREILNGGVRARDQGIVRSFRWTSTAAPVLVAYSGQRPPLAVVVLQLSEQRGAQEVKTSGVSCSWVYSVRGLLVSDIGSTTPGTEYDVTVLIVED